MDAITFSQAIDFAVVALGDDTFIIRQGMPFGPGGLVRRPYPTRADQDPSHLERPP